MITLIMIPATITLIITIPEIMTLLRMIPAMITLIIMILGMSLTWFERELRRLRSLRLR